MGQKLSNLRGIFGVPLMDNRENANIASGNALSLGNDMNDTSVSDSSEYGFEDNGIEVSSNPTLPPPHVEHIGNNSNSRATDKADDIFENIYSNGTEVPKPEEVNGNVYSHEAAGGGHLANSLCSCSLKPDNCVCEQTVSCQNKNVIPSRNSSEEVGTSYFRRGSTRTPSLVSSKRSRGKSLRSSKDVAATGSKKKRNHWVLKFNCARLKGGSSCGGAGVEPDIPEPNSSCDSCVCTGYRRTEEHHLGAGVVFEAAGKEQPARRHSKSSSESGSSADDISIPSADVLIDMAKFNPEDYPVEDCDERARLERAREIAEGVEPPPGFCPGQHIQLICPPALTLDNLTALFQTHLGIHSATLAALSQIDVTLAPAIHRGVHTQVDYIHCLVPDLLQITSCSFYWGKMDRYEAERLLEGRPEGTFLLRDSAQEEYLFSVSFRKYGRSLHARIEQWNHHFSFDSHDPGVYASSTVCGLIEHYKDPACCMFFEPMLTIPLHRNFPFPLQHLCRAVISSKATYDGVSQLQLPKALKGYLKEYHYKQRVRVRIFDFEP